MAILGTILAKILFTGLIGVRVILLRSLSKAVITETTTKAKNYFRDYFFITKRKRDLCLGIRDFS